MKAPPKTAILLAGLMAIAPAQAQTSAADNAALRAEIAELKARLAALEAKVDQGDASSLSAPSSAVAPSSAASTPPSTTPPAAPPMAVAASTPMAAPADKIGWKGAPQISTGDGWSFKPRGRVMLDAGYVSSPAGVSDPGLGFSNELRRARLGVDGTMPGGFGYKLEMDFSADSVVVIDAFLDYQDGPLVVTVGQHNPFQGLEELSSSNDTSFIERAAFTDAFDFIRRVGISAQYNDGPWLVQGGVFTANAEDLLDDANNAVGGDARLVYAPKLGATQLHFGGSVHYRDLGETEQRVIYRQRPLLHTTDVRFIGTPSLTAKDTFGYGLEAAAISGRFHAAAETFSQHVDSETGFDPTFFGASLEAGYFFTDDSRVYRGGMFRGVKVSDPVSDGGIGAIQANIRYDRLDLIDGPIIGGTQDGYEASLIWTPVDYVRFLMTYGHLVYRDAILPGTNGNRDYAVDEIGARAQIAF